MTALGLVALWALAGPIRDNERAAVAALRLRQACSLFWDQRDALWCLLDHLPQQQGGTVRQGGTIRWQH